MFLIFFFSVVIANCCAILLFVILRIFIPFLFRSFFEADFFLILFIFFRFGPILYAHLCFLLDLESALRTVMIF